MIKIDKEKSKVKMTGDSEVIAEEIYRASYLFLRSAAEIDQDMFNVIAGNLVVNLTMSIIKLEKKYGYDGTLDKILEALEEVE